MQYFRIVTYMIRTSILGIHVHCMSYIVRRTLYDTSYIVRYVVHCTLRRTLYDTSYIVRYVVYCRIRRTLYDTSYIVRRNVQFIFKIHELCFFDGEPNNYNSL